MGILDQPKIDFGGGPTTLAEIFAELRGGREC